MNRETIVTGIRQRDDRGIVSGKKITYHFRYGSTSDIETMNISVLS